MLSFTLIGRFSPVCVHSRLSEQFPGLQNHRWLSEQCPGSQTWLSEQFPGSQAAFGTTFRDIGGYRKARISFLERVFGRMVTISKVSSQKRAEKQKLYFIFSSQKDS
jgi:hypothetical protein